MAAYTEEEQKALLEAFGKFDDVECDPEVRKAILESARISSTLCSTDLDLVLN